MPSGLQQLVCHMIFYTKTVMQSDPVTLDPGVVENILGRVLEAFQARMGSLLGYALSKGYAENPAMALQMAAEPAAVLAGEPVAFFVGKATDTTESFVKALMQSGLGSGDESTETIVLMQLAQVSVHLPFMVRRLVGRVYDHAPVNSRYGGRPCLHLCLNCSIALCAIVKSKGVVQMLDHAAEMAPHF